MRRLIVMSASLVATFTFLGCGGSNPAPVTGPAEDSRPKEQKEADDVMQKALETTRKRR